MALSSTVRPQPAETIESPPAAPSDLTAADTDTDVVLHWTDNSDNDIGFLVERRDPGGDWVEIGSTNPDVTGYSDTVSDPGTYYYRVRAFNNFGNSGYSNQVSYTYPSIINDGDVPPAPRNLKATGAGSHVILDWTGNYAMGFIVEKQPPEGVWFEMAKVSLQFFSLSYTDSSRKDMKEFFRDALDRLVMHNQQAAELMQVKGTPVPPPYIPIPNKVDFVKKQNFLAGFFVDKRPLSVLEINNIFFNAQSNALGKAFFSGW